MQPLRTTSPGEFLCIQAVFSAESRRELAGENFSFPGGIFFFSNDSRVEVGLEVGFFLFLISFRFLADEKDIRLLVC